jgi:signal transduction histidine kinase
VFVRGSFSAAIISDGHTHMRLMSLRTRWMLFTGGLVCVVVLTIATYLIVRHEAEVTEARESKKLMMRQEIEKKGLALAQNVALASERAIATVDFLFVTEIINATVKSDPTITYGMVMNAKRQALVHSNPEKMLKVLDGELDRFAAAQTKPTVKPFVLDGQEMIEVISPLSVVDEAWFVRFGISLSQLNAEIAKSEAVAAKRASENLVAMLVATLILAAAAVLLGTYTTSRLLRPIVPLVAGANAIREGDLDRKIEAGRVAEFVDLANAFNSMAAALRERDERLRQNMADLKVALDRAEEANRLKSEFLANISHELRTPLNAIVNVPASLLKEFETFRIWECQRCRATFSADPLKGTLGEVSDEPCPDCHDKHVKLTERVFCVGEAREHQHFLRRLQQSGSHLLNVVNDLLDFSKLEAGKIVLHITDVSVEKQLREVEQTVLPLANDRKLKLTIEYPTAPLSLRADAVKLNQMLINLVGNAIKFTSPGGWVKVSVRSELYNGQNWVRFCVVDNGSGIPADKLNVIFESFRQVDGSHTRSHGGTGLGLAITRQLCELHGGDIWVESEVGRGSTFTFRLPPHGPDRAAPATPAVTGSGKPGARVMVIDDNHVHLELTRMVLEREGFNTELLDYSTGALERIVQSRPDCIILDVMMPQTSGISVLKALKENEFTRKIPVFVATAYHSNKPAVLALGGIWVPKPWDGSALVHMVKAELAAANLSES